MKEIKDFIYLDMEKVSGSKMHCIMIPGDSMKTLVTVFAVK
ncbi:hypothetical protein B0I24_101526 [Aliidiomarina maris]|uniref:Uncharacterized protein n=1 Tax=Aliidiomarina maris TaxID=531312 RepID=A0A327XC80_9GAMM|nr:hypothetical protein B0I24_101526 [Aliidiomarina maris]